MHSSCFSLVNSVLQMVVKYKSKATKIILVHTEKMYWKQKWDQLTKQLVRTGNILNGPMQYVDV